MMSLYVNKSSHGQSSLKTRDICLKVLINLAQAPIGSLTSMINEKAQNLNDQDKGFIHALILETLKRRGQLDFFLSQHIKKWSKLPPIAHWVLRLGGCQILFLQTPVYAAIDTSVSLIKKSKYRHLSGLCNAVLRKLSEKKDSFCPHDQVQCNMPPWLWETIENAYGEEKAMAIAQAHMVHAPIDLTVKSQPEKWAEKLGGHVLASGTVRCQALPNIQHQPGFQEGQWWVQDLASSLAVKSLGNLKGAHVIDLCAAPGGKSMQAANQGAHVTALDQDPKRLARMKENITRCQFNHIQLHQGDGTQWQPQTLADVVVVDAPCSATGTLRRHPDLSLHNKQQHLANLIKKQKLLLHHAWKMVKKSGLLVYSTCSLDPREGENIITQFLQNTPQAHIQKISQQHMDGLNEVICDQGWIRCLPNLLKSHGGMDGFFVAQIKKE